MTGTSSGILWLLIDVVLVLALLVALIYGTMQWRKRSRNPAVDKVSEQATRELYGSGKDTHNKRHSK